MDQTNPSLVFVTAKKLNQKSSSPPIAVQHTTHKYAQTTSLRLHRNPKKVNDKNKTKIEQIGNNYNEQKS